MFKKKDLVRTVEYWMETIQNELFNQFSDYMEKEQMNKTELANKLNVSKGYVSQVLNGTFNFTLKKLIELSLAIGKVPYISFITPEEYLEKEALKKQSRKKEKATEANKSLGLNDLYLKDHYLTIESTLKSIEELKEHDIHAYNYFNKAYVSRLKIMLKSIEAENARVELFLHEIKSPDLFTFRINNKQASAIKIFSLLEKHKNEIAITGQQNGLSISHLTETLKNMGENLEYEINFQKMNFDQN
jgi:transcriptional regulator with XRE-family HTH domain